MHKTDDIRQKLIDHLMGMDSDKMSLADINLYTLILSQLALAEKHDLPPWAQIGVGLASVPLVVAPDGKEVA